jgi:GH25 family lysozyme M1 (1,4-beta-N-acetylmuramidase)
VSSNGIDISNHNHPLDISKVTKCDFVIAKRTEGTDFVDTSFDGYAQQCAKLNMGHFGGYHFFHAANQQGRAEAEFFIKHFGPRNGWSIWLDYESENIGGKEVGFGVSGRTDAEAIGLFSATIKSHYPKQKVGLYTNGEGLARIRPYLYEAHIDALWYADPSHPMTDQAAGIPWQIHQYTIVNNIDRDYSVWTVPELKQFFAW